MRSMVGAAGIPRLQAGEDVKQTQLAKRLRMRGNGARQIRAWESGEAPITGPASLAIEYMLKEKAK